MVNWAVLGGWACLSGCQAPKPPHHHVVVHLLVHTHCTLGSLAGQPGSRLVQQARTTVCSALCTSSP
jgi:hypothetical protein